MKKFKLRWRYVILFSLAGYLLFNSGSRALVSNFLDIQKLKSNIKKAEAQNDLYQSRLHRLENIPEFMEHEIRAELKVIGQGEVEYRFLSEEEEKKAKEK
ncbi:MAG: hypothetical protein FWF00_00385 [Endomicrobia bacterium]|nr:hypothetical protein [Endomicrobiia bacterium]MCL2506135.1 hypothetical protein [Endomicrobiia bacterium]